MQYPTCKSVSVLYANHLNWRHRIGELIEPTSMQAQRRNDEKKNHVGKAGIRVAAWIVIKTNRPKEIGYKTVYIRSKRMNEHHKKNIVEKK